jgi:hypothetical protein
MCACLLEAEDCRRARRCGRCVAVRLGRWALLELRRAYGTVAVTWFEYELCDPFELTAVTT